MNERPQPCVKVNVSPGMRHVSKNSLSVKIVMTQKSCPKSLNQDIHVFEKHTLLVHQVVNILCFMRAWTIQRTEFKS